MRLFIFLLLVPVLYAAPPIDDVMDANDDVAQVLEGYYNSSNAFNSSLHLSFGARSRNLSVFATVEIAGLNLLLDNMTHPTEGLSVIVARGYMQDHILAIPSDGYLDFYCDANWYNGGAQYPWRCDLDDDYCFEFENRTFVEYDASVNFTFRNTSESVPFESNLIEVPEAVLDAMGNSSGAENLTVSIGGDILFIYEIDDQEYDGFDCYDVLSNHTATIPFSINASFPVAGDNKLFFLRAPVLREQWFRNNRFDTVVLSQSPLYYAEIRMDGNRTWNATLSEFYNTTGRHGIQVILSNRTNGSWSEDRNLTSPLPLQLEDHSYAFVYGFNHSYTGIGKHNLSLLVNDSFMGSDSYSDILLSRMLSYGGAYTENGSPINESIARGSPVVEKQEMNLVEIGLGFVALVLFLAFLNFWMPK